MSDKDKPLYPPPFPVIVFDPLVLDKPPLPSTPEYGGVVLPPGTAVGGKTYVTQTSRAAAVGLYYSVGIGIKPETVAELEIKLIEEVILPFLESITAEGLILLQYSALVTYLPYTAALYIAVEPSYSVVEGVSRTADLLIDLLKETKVIFAGSTVGDLRLLLTYGISKSFTYGIETYDAISVAFDTYLTSRFLKGIVSKITIVPEVASRSIETAIEGLSAVVAVGRAELAKYPVTLTLDTHGAVWYLGYSISVEGKVVETQLVGELRVASDVGYIVEFGKPPEEVSPQRLGVSIRHEIRVQ